MTAPASSSSAAASRPANEGVTPSGFFTTPLAERDPALAAAIGDELGRQKNQIELIASENIVSRAVLEAQGSVLTNKYAEGYPGRRYYGGCEYVDVAEELAIARAKELFGCAYANVQPHSGAQANQAVFLALLQPGDTFLGLDLAAGGHLTHGAKVNQSGKWFNAVSYGVTPDENRLDYDAVERLAREHKPKLIITGGSAYPREIDFARFRAIADEVGAYFMVDMAHFAGLAATGAYPSPIPHAHVCTTTTHKTLRGPRGGMILSNDEALGKKFNSAVFPGLQGGPLMHVIAAKAVAFGEALTPEFGAYTRAVVENARAMAARLVEHGFAITTGGTDCHLMLVDLRPKGLTGNVAEEALDRAGITCNKNAIPFDPEKPMVTSGIRLGTPAGTTRGFGVAEFRQVADWIDEVLTAAAKAGGEAPEVEKKVRAEVQALCDRFPIYR
ncbi:serine hydroxymethyltransferase [Futiania mangrovi]|uniref:Serine hydroxymethyltransferase n=1 Tax=Futiania mangrovi TaxID=2959716 RepID=A0A9J6PEA3_9PROT|nr:serine hydroxymethyltransferase [Futiania mangrovii]MCP1336083.1 serine hydroxymethyltransferase [Futiania mangrovii]